MMQQYLEIKEKYKEYILMYRLGDFYEMFFDDAKTASGELDLVLTGRDCGEAERAPMCGIPYHAVEGYIGRLVGKGYKVAICEQMEDPATAKGIVKRDVIRMITPGTLIESSLLDEKKNNYICGIFHTETEIGLSFADISTGQISVTSFFGEEKLSKAMTEIGVYAPREVVVNVPVTQIDGMERFLRERLSAVINDKCPERFEAVHAMNSVANRFDSVPTEFEDPDSPCLRAVGGLLYYIHETQKNNLESLKNLNYYQNGEYLEIDQNTRRNLELCETMRSKEKKGTLLWVLDKTKTAAGARLLKKYIDFPLKNPVQINKRQDAVEELCTRVMDRGEICTALQNVLDLERLITRIVYGSANCRDLVAVKQTAEKLPEIRRLLASFECEELSEIYAELDTLEDIYSLISASIIDEPPFSVREAGFIRKGYNADVDYLREIVTDSTSWISRIEEEERNATGIKNLKVGYNRVFGYYIEVSKSNIGSVPERFIRKQTLTNGERYITEELKQMEAQILGASEKLSALEYKLFCDIRETVASNVHRIQKTAFLLAKLDVYCSFAEVASRNSYVRPEVSYGDVISIKDGRHPVVEQYAKDSYFVPNDTKLDSNLNKFMLITGPNMAGKSTYMRQVALITVMAQIGSFVPAREASIGVADKIFTRVGASDDLAMGQSTFMLEMSEVAYILHNATRKSLIIYDEIGRGTSTFDGMAIARAVAEYTLKKVGAKTLFATHYHELTTLEEEEKGVVNYNIAAKKRSDDIIFLRKIVKGAADDSYGIEVAKLAGVPNEVVKTAKKVLADLVAGAPSEAKSKKKEQEPEMGFITFDNMNEKDACDKLRAVDINTITPIEALNLIFELKKDLD
ncbi:MAG: DNA mismatch repair protein MutS [Ruminococcaceae bacterium]|nr:DNA mismatch repair protein MutS [Oscillospiraceae bacterium]